MKEEMCFVTDSGLVCIENELKAEVQRLILVMKKGSHVSCHKTLQIKWILSTTVIGVLEMPKEDKSDAVPIAVGRA